jgi:hypothetical protein
MNDLNIIYKLHIQATHACVWIQNEKGILSSRSTSEESSRLINQQAVQTRLGSNDIQRLPDLENSSTLAQPIFAQDLGPAL